MVSRFIRLLNQDQPNEIDRVLAAFLIAIALIGIAAVNMLA